MGWEIFNMENKIYNENCLDVMRRMPDDACKIIVTSPPYNMNLRIRNGKYCSRQIVKEISTKYKNYSDNLPMEEYYLFNKNVINEGLRVASMIFYNVQFLTGNKVALFNLIGEFSKVLKEIIVWNKVNAEPAIGKSILNSQFEVILVFDKVNPISRKFQNGNFERGTLSNCWDIKRGKKAVKTHGATFPIELAEKIILNFSNKGEIIFDPFMGTGTTIVAAKKLERRWIGAELDFHYFEIAKERIEQINETKREKARNSF